MKKYFLPPTYWLLLPSSLLFFLLIIILQLSQNKNKKKKILRLEFKQKEYYIKNIQLLEQTNQIFIKNTVPVLYIKGIEI